MILLKDFNVANKLKYSDYIYLQRVSETKVSVIVLIPKMAKEHRGYCVFAKHLTQGIINHVLGNVRFEVTTPPNVLVLFNHVSFKWDSSKRRYNVKLINKKGISKLQSI
jgi:hypothetical protein